MSQMEQIVPLALHEVEFPNDEELLVHDWRVEQLERLGIETTIAETFAGVVDWHELAGLVERGCAPHLALEIVR